MHYDLESLVQEYDMLDLLHPPFQKVQDDVDRETRDEFHMFLFLASCDLRHGIFVPPPVVFLYREEEERKKELSMERTWERKNMLNQMFRYFETVYI